MRLKIDWNNPNIPHLKRFLILSAATLTVLFSLIVLLYHVFERIELQAVAERNKEFSTHVDTMSNSFQKTLNRMLLQIFYSPEAIQLRETNSLNCNSCVAALRRLNFYMSSCPFIDCIEVYNEKTQYIYSTSSRYDSAPVDEFYDAETANLVLKCSESHRFLPIWSSLPTDESPSVKGCYSFLFYETDKTGKPNKSGAVVIKIPYDQFVSQLLGNNPSDSYVILSDVGSLIAAKTEDMAVNAAEFWNRMNEKSQNGEKSGYLIGEGHGGDRTVCLYSQMQSNNWYCIQILTYRTCLPQLTFLHDKVLPVLAVVFTLFVMLLLVLLIYIYFPFKQMISSLKSVQRKANLFNLQGKASISDQMNCLVENSLQLTLDREFSSLLNGNSVSFSKQPIPPLALILIDYSAFEDLITSLHLMQPNATVAAVNGMHAILLSGFKDVDAPLALCTQLYTRYHCSCYYSVNFDSPAKIYSHFKNLLELYHLKILLPSQHVIHESVLQTRQTDFNLAESDKNFLQLENALHTGSLEDAKNIYRFIFDSVAKYRYSDFCFALNKIYQITCDQQQKIGLSYENVSMEDLLSHMDTCEQLHQYFYTIFQKITEWRRNQKHEKMRQTAQKVIQYIKYHYNDPQLSAQRIAENMGISATYLGKTYRKISGKAIADTIHEVRIGHAKELLTTTQQTATSIANSLGYADAKYFFVLFKRATGMTPLQYRKKHTPDSGTQL